MSTYVVGDIHGCYKEWIQLKDKIESKDNEAKFILIGDIIDRGPKTFEMLDWAMQNITSDGKYQMVLGNHEHEKIQWLKEYFKRKDMVKNITIKNMEPDNYDFYDMCVQNNLSDQQLKDILNWFNQLPYYKEVYVDMQKGKQRFIVVHSYLPRQCLNKDESFKKTSVKGSNSPIERYARKKLKTFIIWERHFTGYGYKKVIVVHGHTPTISRECTIRGAKSGKIWFAHNDINVDCGAVFKEHYKEADLGAVRLEDLEEFYVYTSKEPEDKENIGIYKQNMLEKRKRQKKEEDTIFSDEEFLKNFW